MSSASSIVDEAIENNSVTVFAKSFCPHSKATKELLKSLDVNAKIFDIDLMDEGADMQNYLQEKTGQRTVPNVFINKKHIGGNSDLQKLNSDGELKKLIGQS